ncbi:Sp140 nuclear body protein [Apodemus speciosus]|uniref:Sp140 nuclear body protein n=1 Tax=Apodemus speciosus TaxID=105296 RepID=A0ABQ0EEB1_APOSI
MTIPEDQNEEESADYQILFKHFKENKVEIASAITKPFPFLMSLRDRDFISEQRFQECRETCKNLVPVDSVVYDILSEVQKKFSRDLLKVIFSKPHLKAYPDLKETLKHFFLNVSDNHRTPQRMNGRDVEERPRLPSVVGEASCSPGNSNTNDKRAEEVPSLPQWNGGEGSSSCEQMCDGQELQDNLFSFPRLEAASCIPGNSKMNDRQAEEMPSLPQCNGGEGSSSCEQMCDGQEPQDDLSSSLRHEAEAVDTRRNIPAKKSKKQKRKKERLQLVKTKMEKATERTEKTCGRIAVGQAALRRKKMKKNPGLSAKIRDCPRRRRKENANFSAELLPVTCGDLKGVLHKDKFKQGISVMSIQCQDGNWFTPTEFEIMGGRGPSKNWKLSLRCYNWPLKFLIQVCDTLYASNDWVLTASPGGQSSGSGPEKLSTQSSTEIWQEKKEQRTQNLFRSPADLSTIVHGTLRSRRNMPARNISDKLKSWCLEDKELDQNADECEVCRDGGTLFCCDTCSRAFHQECHIPTVETEMTPWSCIFCRMQSLGSQQSLPESEILKREMVAQEQLFRETAVGVEEPMWLDIIKKKLNDQAYCQVKDFVHDMRLIFRNHRISFKDPKFGEMGLRLESKFEKSFKEVFSIQETDGKS